MNDPVLSELKQRRFLTRLYFKIQEKGIEFRVTNFFNTVNHKIPFEEIPEEPNEVTISSKTYFWAMIIFWAAFIIVLITQITGGSIEASAYIIWGGLAVICSAFYLLNKTKCLVYKAGASSNALVFFKNKPSPDLLKAFIENVQKKKHEYLKKTYLVNPIESNSADAIQKLNALLTMGALTQEEFEKLKAEVIRKAESGGNISTSLN